MVVSQEDAIMFLEFVCKYCQYIQDNIVEYKGKCYVTFGKPFDDVKSTEDLYYVYLNKYYIKK